MRAFVGIPLPQPLRQAAATLISSRLGSARGWRPAREEGLHVTLKFLGEVTDVGLGPLDDALRAAGTRAAPMSLHLHGLRVVPSAQRPRLLWLDVVEATGALVRLAGTVEAAAVGNGFAAEERPFTGHATLARAGRDALPRTVRSDDGVDLGKFLADRMVLFSSRLGRGGSIYAEVGVYPFQGAS